MVALIEGFAFYIRILLLLFTWLMVAVFVSGQLASLMGLAVIALALFVFIPLNYYRERAWQKRQRMIMGQALEYSPERAQDYEYTPGTALPPPEPGGDVIVAPKRGGAVDVYRDLPPLPPLEARSHARSFKRTLVLPIVGLLMFLGGENDIFMQRLLEGQGMATQPPVAFDKIMIPAAVEEIFADKRTELENVARAVHDRVGACGPIAGGRVEPMNQLESDSRKIEALKGADYVYVLECEGRSSHIEPFSVWMAPQDLHVGRVSSLMNTLEKPLAQTHVRQLCLEAGDELVRTVGGRLLEPQDINKGVVLYEPALAPSSGHVYMISEEKLVVAGPRGERRRKVVLSCWVSPEGEARVRFIGK